MLSKTIIHILLRYLCIIFAFLIYTSILTIYMYINSIRWDLWPDGTFILLMIIFAVVWIIMTGLYYLMFHFIWNKKHLPYYIVSIETFIAIIIFHFSEEFISDYLLRLSNQYGSNWLINIFETYTVIIPIFLGIIFYLTSFLIRNKINK